MQFFLRKRLGTRYRPAGTRFEILGTRTGSLKHLKKRVYFAIQLESTDGSNRATVLCFVQYQVVDFEEELLCCLDLPGMTTSSGMFRSLNE